MTEETIAALWIYGAIWIMANWIRGVQLAERSGRPDLPLARALKRRRRR